MVPQVRPDLCERPAPPPTPNERQVAPRRGLHSRINGATHYLWRAVDQDGNVLDILVQSRRNPKAAAKKFFRKLLKGLRYVPRVVITDKLAKLRGGQA